MACTCCIRGVEKAQQRTWQPMRKGAKGVEVPELLAEADVISLHCPLTSAIDELINRAWRAICRTTARLWHGGG
ncbi:NAD(P)-dependent oxidoreductase [Paenibacillus pabuli]|uniref:NAD(P)-dependent oxidoreductase n=1 Tax=Paenibacillus pabuli TaxID=1472 RepID=UPI003D6A0B14